MKYSHLKTVIFPRKIPRKLGNISLSKFTKY